MIQQIYIQYVTFDSYIIRTIIKDLMDN